MKQATSHTPMRLLTYNIHRWTGMDGRCDVPRLASLLAANEASIIALQEVLHPMPDGSEPLAALAERLGMQWVFGLSDPAARWRGRTVRLGNAILSRYPILSSSNEALPQWPGLARRAILSVRICPAAHLTLSVHTTHLDHLLEPLRWRQLSAVLKVLRRHRDEPHWLMGDFNAPSLAGTRSQAVAWPIIHRLRHIGYVDAFAAVGEGLGATFPSDWPLLRLDYLFVARRWANGLRHCWAADGQLARCGSDHLPVIAEWSL